MASLAVEREMLEKKVNSACIKIQSIVRMRIQLKKYREYKEKTAEDAKRQLYEVLNQMEDAVKETKFAHIELDEAATKI